jgi:hypothetical protein
MYQIGSCMYLPPIGSCLYLQCLAHLRIYRSCISRILICTLAPTVTYSMSRGTVRATEWLWACRRGGNYSKCDLAAPRSAKHSSRSLRGLASPRSLYTTSLAQGERFDVLFCGSDEFSTASLRALVAAKGAWPPSWVKPTGS